MFERQEPNTIASTGTSNDINMTLRSTRQMKRRKQRSLPSGLSEDEALAPSNVKLHAYEADLLYGDVCGVQMGSHDVFPFFAGYVQVPTLGITSKQWIDHERLTDFDRLVKQKALADPEIEYWDPSPETLQYKCAGCDVKDIDNCCSYWVGSCHWRSFLFLHRLQNQQSECYAIREGDSNSCGYTGPRRLK